MKRVYVWIAAVVGLPVLAYLLLPIVPLTNKHEATPVTQPDAQVPPERAHEAPPVPELSGSEVRAPVKAIRPARTATSIRVLSREPPPVPSSEDCAALVGLEVQDASIAELSQLKVPEGQTGVVVSAVDPASPAAEAALQKGDVIVRAQRDKITSRDSLRTAVGARDYTLLTVYRNGYPFQVVLHKPFKSDKAEH